MTTTFPSRLLKWSSLLKCKSLPKVLLILTSESEYFSKAGKVLSAISAGAFYFFPIIR
jgi:hypothetical protein